MGDRCRCFPASTKNRCELAMFSTMQDILINFSKNRFPAKIFLHHCSNQQLHALILAIHHTHPIHTEYTKYTYTPHVPKLIYITHTACTTHTTHTTYLPDHGTQTITYSLISLGPGTSPKSYVYHLVKLKNYQSFNIMR